MSAAAHDAAEITFAMFAVQVTDFVAIIQQPTGSRNLAASTRVNPLSFKNLTDCSRNSWLY